MLSRRKRWLLAAALAGAMAALSACDAVGGVDLNGAIAESAAAASSEGTLRLEWNIAPSPAADRLTRDKIAALGSGAFAAGEVLTESPEKMSLRGELELPGGAVPVELYMDGDTLTVAAEGLKRPYVLELGGGDGQGGELLALITEALKGGAREAVGDFLKMILLHIPNPPGTSAGTRQETLGGSEKTLQTVAFGERPLAEMFEALAAALESAAGDAEGLEALLDAHFDTLKPVFADMLNPSLRSLFLNIANSNRAGAVRLAAQQIEPRMKELAGSLRGMASGEKAAAGADSSAAVTLLFDGGTMAGMDLALRLTPPEGKDDAGIASVRIRAESRWWNVNGEVSAKDPADGAIPFPRGAKPRERLNNVEPDSLLYDVLRNGLHVTRYSFSMYMGDNAAVPDGVSPYIKGAGTTMVPVRFVSEQLDAKVEWDAAARRVTITDDTEGVTIVLHIDDMTATVNGEAKTLAEAPEIINGSTFVPIKFIVTELRGSIHWDGERGVVTITKEY